MIGAKLLMIARTLPEYVATPSELWSRSFLEGAGDFTAASWARSLPPPSTLATSWSTCLAHSGLVRARYRARTEHRAHRLFYGG
jgi:hypothetical protein